MWKNKERTVDLDGVFGLSIIKHVTLQRIVAHDFQYDSRMLKLGYICKTNLIFESES
jgi:hypothetical protein